MDYLCRFLTSLPHHIDQLSWHGWPLSPNLNLSKIHNTINLVAFKFIAAAVTGVVLLSQTLPQQKTKTNIFLLCFHKIKKEGKMHALCWMSKQSGTNCSQTLIQKICKQDQTCAVQHWWSDGNHRNGQSTNILNSKPT